MEACTEFQKTVLDQKSTKRLLQMAMEVLEGFYKKKKKASLIRQGAVVSSARLAGQVAGWFLKLENAGTGNGGVFAPIDRKVAPEDDQMPTTKQTKAASADSADQADYGYPALLQSKQPEGVREPPPVSFKK